MTEGLELRGYEFTWTTKKPYWKYPRKSSDFLLEGNKCYFELVVKRATSEDYEIRICNNRRPLLQVSTYIQHPDTYEECGRIEQIIRGSETIGTFHVEIIAEDMIGFHAMKFMNIVTVIRVEQLQLCPNNDDAPGMPIKDQGYPEIDNRLSLDFGKLLEEGPNHDVELTCQEEGGPSIKAHVAILIARSPVLRKMFENRMVEGLTGLVRIPDVEADVLQAFVEYLYTGNLEISMDNAQSIYEAGSKYMVEGLLRKSADFLIANLTVENALEVLIMADAHDDQHLKERTVSYILDGSIPSLQDKQWQTFADSHRKLAYDALYQFYKSHRHN